ncbi:NAD-binding protein, partial [Jeongeupia naejangsanensis]
LADRWWLVLIILVILLPLKIAMIAGIARWFGASAGVSLRTGFALGQGGEFAFVLLTLAGSGKLLPDPLLQATTAAIVLSMLATPFIVQHSDKLVLRFAASEWMNMAANLHQIAVRTMQSQGHVIVCGYGRSGQSLARILTEEKIPFFALDLDPEKVREAGAAGESVVFGDAAKREVLMAAGLMRARALVVSYADTHSAMKILELAHQIRPELPVIVRTYDETDVDKLKNAGAAEVVAEILEGSLMLASHTLMLLGVPLNTVLKRIRHVREDRYQMFRGFFRGTTEDLEDNASQPRLHTIHLNGDASAIGRRLGDIGLAGLHVEVKGVRRKSMPPTQVQDELVLQENDVLVLLGEPENLAAAEMILLQGS